MPHKILANHIPEDKSSMTNEGFKNGPMQHSSCQQMREKRSQILAIDAKKAFEQSRYSQSELRK